MIATPSPSSRSDLPALRLRQEILAGAAAPGNLLAESAVARRLGVSRVPVREALFALEREGLVEFSDTGSAFVRDLTARDFEEIYALRLALEPLAARLATSRFKDDVSALEKNLAATRKAKSVEQITRLDLEFHEIILETSGNARLLKLWGSLRGELELWLGRLHRTHQMQTRDTLDETIGSHTKLVKCFATQPPAACERLMRQHILGWREWLPVTEADN